ncbi:MAG: 50S ribosomal protein L15 [Bdellovibrio sp. CG10_big_fil_rev_8_21_14_0_10_47_8]|nr:MAG: 50S ribosomal protein L15 [Bdellovibrio sp. CG10_big_fil_rev_8_21_14_0_10_47_8]
MSLLSQLAPAEGSKHYQKRLGRGRGSGLGQTAGKGHKGQLARSGGKVRRGFEGGQTPLMRRLPKFGFNNTNFETKYSVVNLHQLEALSGEVTPETLKAAGIVHRFPVKILGRGKLTKKLTVQAHKFSDTAKAAIEAAGGKTEVIK